MTRQRTPRSRAAFRRWRGIYAVIAAFAGSAALVGCSQVPDAINPIEWRNSVVDAFTDEEVDESSDKENHLVAERGEDAPGGDKPFPNLGETPDKPKTLSKTERERIAEGLVADRQERRYAGADIRRQGDAVRPLNEEAASAFPPERPSMPTKAPPAKPRPEPRLTPLQAPASSRPLTTEESVKAVKETFAQRLNDPVPPGAGSGPPRLRSTSDLFGGYQGETSMSTVVVSSGGIDHAVGVPMGRMLTPPAQLTPAPASSPGLHRSAGGPVGGPLKVATIQFGNGSSRLGQRDKAILRDVVRLQRQRGGRFHIVGHASSRTRPMDPVRHQMVNFKISAARADAIAQALIGMGVKPDDVVVTAKSDGVPMFYEVMPTGEAGNRRAVIYLIN